ncbi:6-aminohexanoate-dimer hydrolase [Thermoflexales bacterium]|nr:6-aminohexanoate-dimer hydrolase [Thermoflexales bacterium]
MSKRQDLNRSIRCLALRCALTLLLAGCSNLPATVAAPPVPTSTTETRSSTSEAQNTDPPLTPSVPVATTAPHADWPTTAWSTSAPEAQGLDAPKLAEMLAAIEQRQLDLHSLLIIRNGYLVSETYFGSYQADTRHQLYSCTKSFIATLVGIALDKGYLEGTDQRILDFFPAHQFANLDEQKSAMTLEDTLTMRTGLAWQEGDPAYRELFMSADWLKTVLDKPMDSAPGSEFNYCSGCSHVLSAVLHQATDTNPRDFADQHLFKPLGISNVRWDSDAEGIPVGGWGLQLTPRDMAKLGYLYLHKGQWDGQQIVSAQWVEDATRTHAETGGDLGYGYQWWTYPALEAYTALGRGGQTIFVVPELDLIVVTTAQLDDHDEIFNLVRQYILPAVQKAE